MKKITSILSLCIFSITLILFFPINAMADEDLIIPEWVVNAELIETGNLEIVEDITFEFNDDFNGVFREIVLDKTSGVSTIGVEEISGNTLSKYNQVEDADKGDSGVFLINSDDEKVIIQIFSPSENEQKTFRIRYEVKNVAIKYQDTAELYYKFLGDENKTLIENFIVNIVLPQVTTSNNVKLFAHGPLNGEFGQKSDTTFFIQVKDIPPGTFVEGRVLFPRDFIPLSNNTMNIDNYTNIIEEEATYQVQIEEERKRKEALGKSLGQISLVTSLIGFIIFIVSLILFRRQRDFRQIDDYTIVPEDCTPAIATYLTSTLIHTNTIFATILDLCRKEYIKIDNKKDNIDFTINENDFIVSQIKEADDSLLNHEKHFIHWFITIMGNEKSVSTQEIESFSKDKSSEFVSLHTQWIKIVKEDAIKKGYFDKSKRKYGVFFILLFLPLLILSIFTLVYGSLLGLTSLALSITLFIYGLTMLYRHSDYGYQQYKKWQDFKKHMKRSKKVSSIEDLTEYPLDISLIYALALGVQNPIVGLNMNKNNQDNSHHNNGWIIWYFLFLNNKNNAFEKSLDTSFGGNASSYSGGGFSGGGGGGAGGGGAGGF